MSLAQTIKDLQWKVEKARAFVADARDCLTAHEFETLAQYEKAVELANACHVLALEDLDLAAAEIEEALRQHEKASARPKRRAA